MKELLNPDNWIRAHMGRNVNLDKLLVTGRLKQDEFIVLNLEINFNIDSDLSFNINSYSINAKNATSSHTFYDFTKQEIVTLYSDLAKSCEEEAVSKDKEVKNEFLQTLNNLLISNEGNTE